MIELLLGDKTKIKILRFFLEFPLVKRNVREVAVECKQGFGVTSTALKELSDIGILSREESGREKLYFLNKNSEFFEILQTLFKTENYLNLPLIYRNLLADIAVATRKSAHACILFGSLVTGTYREESDVDLLFVSEKEEAVRRVCTRVEGKYGIKIQAIVIKPGEIEEFRKTDLFKTIKKESVVLFGKAAYKEWFG